MKRKSILVTGGIGFIGSNLVKHLTELNYFVVILDKKTYSSNLSNLKKINNQINGDGIILQTEECRPPVITTGDWSRQVVFKDEIFYIKTGSWKDKHQVIN